MTASASEVHVDAALSIFQVCKQRCAAGKTTYHPCRIPAAPYLTLSLHSARGRLFLRPLPACSLRRRLALAVTKLSPRCRPCFRFARLCDELALRPSPLKPCSDRRLCVFVDACTANSHKYSVVLDGPDWRRKPARTSLGFHCRLQFRVLSGRQQGKHTLVNSLGLPGTY